MKIKQFRYSFDNLGYLVYGEKDAVAIDGGALKEMLSFLKAEALSLKFVTNTHSHADHTVGTQQLAHASKAVYLDNKTLQERKGIDLEGNKIAVYHTPGHTQDSVVFHFDNILVTGDTLFNGTVGNCFSGDLKGFYESIEKLFSLPGETVVYAGHDYVKDSMAVAKRMEPDNKEVDRFLKKYTPDHIWSTLAEERKINPYVRFNEPGIIDFLEKMGLPVGSEYERWESVMAID